MNGRQDKRKFDGEVTQETKKMEKTRRKTEAKGGNKQTRTREGKIAKHARWYTASS